MANSKLNKLTKNGITYDLQDKEISDKLSGVTGIIKDNAGTLSAAVAGTDYGYPMLKGAGVPSTSTVASVGQHYFDTSAAKAPYEYVCIAAGSIYTWVEVGGSGAGTNLIADEYSASSAYAIGDVVIYEDSLYKCNTTISSGEAWNASHWTATTVDGLISELLTNVETINAGGKELSTGGNLNVGGLLTVGGRTRYTYAGSKDDWVATCIDSLVNDYFARLALIGYNNGNFNAILQLFNKDGTFVKDATLLHTGNKNQIFTYGTEDLTAGSSSLETGKLYFVYE